MGQVVGELRAWGEEGGVAGDKHLCFHEGDPEPPPLRSPPTLAFLPGGQVQLSGQRGRVTDDLRLGGYGAEGSPVPGGFQLPTQYVCLWGSLGGFPERSWAGLAGKVTLPSWGTCSQGIPSNTALPHLLSCLDSGPHGAMEAEVTFVST